MVVHKVTTGLEESKRRVLRNGEGRMQPTAQPDAATRSTIRMLEHYKCQFSARKVTLSLELFCFTSKHSKVTWSSSTHDASSHEPLCHRRAPSAVTCFFEILFYHTALTGVYNRDGVRLLRGTN